MLAVVKYEQESATHESIDDLVHELITDAVWRGVRHADRRGDRAVHFGWPPQRAQVTEANAVGVPVGHATRELEGETRLPGPARAAKRYHAGDNECGLHRGHVVLATHEAADRDRERAPGRWQPMLQDPTLELNQRRSGLEAVLGQLSAPLVEYRERVGLPADVVERFHQVCTREFALGVFRDK